MGDVIQFPTAQIISDDNVSAYPTMTREDVHRLESIRDNVEELLNMVAGVHRDPEAVALAATRFGMMRMFQMKGRAASMSFANRCVETAEIAEDLIGS